MDVLLKLADGFSAEGVGDDFAFAGVFGAVAGVEEAALDGDEGVVVFAGGKEGLVLVWGGGDGMGREKQAYAFKKPFPWP